MSRQDILNVVAKIEKLFSEMKTLIEKVNYEIEYENSTFRPELNETYYFVDGDFKIHEKKFKSETIDHIHLNRKNCFKNGSLAIAEAEKIAIRRQLEDIARRLNKEQEVDWNDNEQSKFCLIYDHSDNTICTANCGCLSINNVYCLNENFRAIAVKEIGEERMKKYLRGE